MMLQQDSCAQIFKFGEQPVRTDRDENGEPLFCAADVARVLGYERPTKAVNDHCKGVLKRDTLTKGGKQQLNFIPERDLYRLVMHSRLPEAEAFEEWVVGEVLPSIRKTGGYHKLVPKSLPEALELAAKAIREKDALLLQAKKDEPFVIAGRAMLNSEACCRIGDFAKAVEIDGKVIGPILLFRFLRKRVVLFKNPNGDNMPYETHRQAGRFIVQQGTHPDGKGNEVIHFTTYITPKGEGYVANLLAKSPDFEGMAITVRGQNVRMF